MGTVNGEYLGSIYAFKSGWQVANYSTTEISRAGVYLDTDGSSIHHTSVVKFTVPAFTGVSQKIAFKMWANRMGSEYPSTINLRYAICKADTNKDSYKQTNEAVTDDNQITSGTVKLTDVSTAAGSATWQTVTIETDTLTEGTWYLMLWSASAPSTNEVLVMQGTSYHDSITLTYGDAPEEPDPEEPEKPDPEPEETFCGASFRIGLAVGLGLDGWYKEDETDG